MADNISFINNIFRSSHIFSEDEILLKFKFKILNAVILVTIIFTFIFFTLSILGLSEIGKIQTIANFTVSTTSVFLLLLLRKSKEMYKVISYLFYVISFLNYCLAIYYVINDEFRMIWLYLLVVSVYITGTVRIGDFVTFCSIIFIILMNIVSDLYLSKEAVISAVLGLVILLLLLRSYAKKIVDFEHEVIAKNKFIVDELNARVSHEVEKNLIQEKTLIEQSKKVQMGELINMISHQWKQPISTISMISSNIQIRISLETLDLNKENKDFLLDKLNNIDKMIQVMHKTMDDFRNFYNVDKKYILSSIDIIIKKSLDIINPILKSNNIEVIQELNATSNLNVYENELIQVIINILKNSYDNSNLKNLDNQWIKIKTEKNTIEISDNGGGIPEDVKNKIFESYFSTKNDTGGSGLGLYMSKVIVEEHHKGKIEAINTPEGVCFRIEVATSLGN